MLPALTPAEEAEFICLIWSVETISHAKATEAARPASRSGFYADLLALACLAATALTLLCAKL